MRRVHSGKQGHCRLCLIVFIQHIEESDGCFLRFRIGLGEEQAALEQHELACHYDKFCRDIHIVFLRLPDQLQILVAKEGDGDIFDFVFTFLDQCEKRVKRALKLVKTVGKRVHPSTSQ